MAGYDQDVNFRLNFLSGALGGITAITAGMSALTSTFGEFGTQASDVFGELDGLLVTSTALMVSFGIEAANAYGEFEQGMKIVQTVSGQAQYSIQQLGDEANKLSTTYRVAIGDITEGLQTLGRAGLNSAASQLEVLESGLQTAKLEGRNLNGVLEELIQNTAMLGGDLKSVDFGSQAEYLNSLLVGTSMTAPIDSHDISQTLQYAGGTAAAAGANLNDKDKLEDLMGTVAAFAQKGVTGSMAGTALRAFLTKPASQDASVLNALEQLNLKPEDLWENGGNSMRSVSDQIGIIKRHMDAMNLSTMEQVELWGKIVGPKMGQQMMKLDSDSVKELTRDIQSATDAETLANQTLNTYNQNVSALGENGQLVFRGLGEKAVMFLNPIVEVINKILNLLSNPAINTMAFIGAAAIISRGLQAGWNMLKVIKNEIMDLINGVKGGLQTTASETNGLVAPAQRYTKEIDNTIKSIMVMNTNLADTESLMGRLQLKFLGPKYGNSFVTGMTSKDTLDSNVVSIYDNQIKYKRKTPYEYISDEGKVISQSEYDQLKKKDKKGYTRQRSFLRGWDRRLYVRDIMPKNGDYNNLSAEEKKLYEKMTMQTQTRFGSYAQMMQDIDKTTEKAFLYSEYDIQKAAEESGEGIARQYRSFNKKFQEALAKEIGDRAIWDEESRSYIYSTYHQPKKMSHEDMENDKAIAKAKTMARAHQIEMNNLAAQTKQESLSKRGQWANQSRQKFSDRREQYGSLKGWASNKIDSATNSISNLGKKSEESGNKINAVSSNFLREMGLIGPTFTQMRTQADAYMLTKDGEIRTTVQKELSSMSLSEAMETAAANSGLTASEFADLILTSQDVRVSFAQLAMAAEEDVIATAGETVGKSSSALGNALSSVTGALGGGFTAALMGGMLAIQAVQAAQQAWQKAMQEAEQKISESMDSMSKAEDTLKEQYLQDNPSSDEDASDEALLEAYSAIYDSQKTNTTVLDENTRQLAYNTEALKMDIDAASQQTTEDMIWGQKSFGTIFSDFGGAFMTQTGDAFSDLADFLTGNLFSSDRAWYNIQTEKFERTSGVGYFDTQSIVLTASQSADDYPWLKEFAPILAADVWKLGTTGGLQQAFGGDYNKIVEMLSSINGKVGDEAVATSAFGVNAANVQEYFNENIDQNRLQYAFKNFGTDFSLLGKQMRAFEKANKGRSVFGAYTKGDRQGLTGMKYLETQDKKLMEYIKSLSIKTGMSEQQVIMAAQLKQLQDMQEIAKNSVEPSVLQMALQSAQQVMLTNQTLGTVEGSGSGAILAGNNAAAIAAFLQVEAEGKLKQQSKSWAEEQALKSSDGKFAGMTSDEIAKLSDEEFYSKMMSGYNQGDADFVKAANKYFESFAMFNARMGGYDYEGAKKFAADFIKGGINENADAVDIINTLRNGANSRIAQSILDAYDLAEFENSTPDAGSGGSGSGDGSGKSSSDSGDNKKSRVDLVLCSKKEIPKLDVNLFKKEPNFTILNKNFKLRDIKINTQDKPKAILDAVKNGIIETQKRMDPKIIQSQDAEYDPVAATEGSSTPSGSVQTNTA